MTDTTTSPFLQRLEDTLVPKADTDDAKLWSVTTILKVLSSPGLEYWQREEVSKFFVSIAKSLPVRIEEEGVDEVIKAGINAPFRKPKGARSSAQLGTDFHSVAEIVAITGRFPDSIDDELRPLVDQFAKWLDRAQPEFFAAEMPVYNLSYGHAGTMDGGMKLQGVRLAHDYKTSKKSFDKQGRKTHPYPEAGLQLSAYIHSEYAVPLSPRRFEQRSRRYYLFGNPERDHAVPVPPVDGGMVLHVTPEHCDAYVMRCDDVVYERFLYLIEAMRWQQEIAPTVVGDILQFEKVG